MKELLDITLLQLYELGERDFCNVSLHNLRPWIAGYVLGYDPANFSNKNLMGINLSGSDLNFAKLENANLSASNLSGSNLNWANLQNANLSEANLSGANLNEANLKNANLCGVDLTTTSLVSAFLKGVIIDENTKFDQKTYLIWEIVNQEAVGRNLIGVDLTGACLDYADLREVNLSNAKLGCFLDKKQPGQYFGRLLYPSSLQGVNLTDANLKDVDLREANLKNAKLQRANLERANLSEAHLENVILNEANLNYANLSQARLSKAKFMKATLYQAVLYQAKLSGSNFLKADLRKSDLRQTSLNSASTLREAYYDDETKFPYGFEPKNKKMVFRTEDYEYVDFLDNLLTLKIKKEKSPPPRPGQDQFRSDLIEIYGIRCIISGCNVEKAIEAAHIIPYNGLHSHQIANGLLLRVDLHRLFDNYLLTLHPETRKVLIAPQSMSSYKDILGNKIELYLSGEDAIKQKHILQHHYQLCSWVNDLIDN